MKNQFQLFWNKNRRDTWTKAAIIGASAAALAVGVLLLLSKLTNIPSWYCLLGIIALPIGTGLFLLFKRSSFQKLAKRMDIEFQLHEKVQTMIAFEKSDDAMVLIQREDTLQKLGQIPTRQLRFANLWLYILLPVLACAMLVTAVACPSQQETPQEDPPYVAPPRDITDWEWAALDDLMEYVKNSEADAQIMKPKTFNALNDLRNLLLKGVSETSLPVFVNTTVTQINNIRTDANSQEGLTDRQMEINDEVGVYTVNTLCQIFGLNPPQEPDETEKPGENEDENKDPSSSGGTGDVTMGANDKLFDSLQGYVAYKDVIADYYGEINKALQEGVLSEDEWYDYLMTYFRYLYGSEIE